MVETLGNTLKKLRKENNLTQIQIADYLNVELSEIEKIENDKGTLKSSSLNKLSALYGCSEEDILNGESSPDFTIKSNQVDLNTLVDMNRIIRNLKQLHELRAID